MTKLGLDLGSSSAGWTLKEDEKIIDFGVVTFNTGMSKGQSGGYVSPTRERREARSKRNLIKSRKYRKWELLKVLIAGDFVPLNQIELQEWSKYKKRRIKKFPESEKFLKWLACDFTYNDGSKYKNPYQLRVKGLTDKLSKYEFGRALYHIVQRRGYKDIGETDKETENQIKRRNEDGFKDALDRHGTVAKALNEEFLEKGKRARNQYPLREEYQHELEKICKAQGYNIEKEGKEDYKDDFVKSLWKAIIWQQPLKTQRGNIGKCTLEPTKPRCPVSHPVFEISRAWQFINTIKYYDENDNKQPLTFEMKQALFHEKFLKKDSNFKFEDIRKFLDKKFKKSKKYNYPINKKTGEYDTSISGMPVCKGLIDIFGEKARKALGEIEQYHIGNAPKIIDRYSIHDLWHIIFDFDEPYLEDFAIKKLNIPNITRKRKKKDVPISPLIELKGKFLQGYGDLSLKALCKIIPFLKEGYLYNEAVVLAKIPELINGSWQEKRDVITKALKKANQLYNDKRAIINITNNLIDKHKGLTNSEKFAYKDFEYILKPNDVEEIKKTCEGYFGEKSWKEKEHKEEIIQDVGHEYQDYFYDTKRSYRKSLTLTEIFKEVLKEYKIELKGELYHHSIRENRYNQNLKTNWETGEKYLPTDKKTGIKILPVPFIDSIKNPMFNKSMSVLRKLINELIKAGKIDEDTEIVVELARELNDNNKRAAIERYQNLRRDNREKYRLFLKEFKNNEKMNFNVEESIPVFELWSEQILEKDEKDQETNKNTTILKEKDAEKRYELWMEQNGQCMYTGKMISISQLFSNEIDIMHTIPRSILPDNTRANMTVGYARYNRDLQKQKMPKECNNYYNDVGTWGTAIEPRLEMWKQEKDKWKSLYESRKKPKGNEDENKKNKRIQEKHYFKMHLDYWKDKVERFEAEEIKDSWARRQLVDTQMVSKYAREFLKLYFKKVVVQKGTVTADFRKLFGFQEEDEIKSRNKHTHHAIDAAVLTLIPVNSSHRERVLKEYYEALENKDKSALARLRAIVKPSSDFNPQELIRKIERNTLIVNYEKDKILNKTFKKVRKRGKIQYVKDKQGRYIRDKKGDRIIKYAKGDTVRSSLYKDTFLGKIKDVERYPDGKPKRKNGNGEWEYKKGEDEFIYTVRKPLRDVVSKVKDIIDPVIREIVKDQGLDAVDSQGNIIRHVRVKAKAGREVKERVNYRSKHQHKNKYYAASDSIPYAILLQKSIGGKVERNMIPIASFEVAKAFKKYGKFNFDAYVNEEYPQYKEWDKQRLKVGQKVLVLKNDNEYKKRKELDFQQKRLYKITQFYENGIYLKYHLISTKDDDIDKEVKLKKDEVVAHYDKKYGLTEIREDETISDVKERKKKYNDDRFRFVGIKDNRFARLVPYMGENAVKCLKKEVSKYKKQSSEIDIEGNTPLLKMGIDNCNLLCEGKDFSVSMLGKINWQNDLTQPFPR
ncbi:type II CRISPR RNA-guided endonuclease Cas9 [Salegentibacter maritimus]|uniref:CRISPR-associated endonuclease Cas9 n=1 Tax=Salegentibacter maritimus TaxID=2794347 RepID=A0ABS0TGC4_9FLAO|nr:type II CRISPR RNA-guided endonuclease Cas9 [Salegentibacter maritimus]MBI6120091.1 hypothetical protein [Salegentibacter maritimus]